MALQLPPDLQGMQLSQTLFIEQAEVKIRCAWPSGIEIEADAMLKGTRVDGIYTADPEKDPTATKFSEISYDQIYQLGLKVMDLTATTMCKENNLPIVVFDMDTKGNLLKVLKGEPIGTVVHP